MKKNNKEPKTAKAGRNRRTVGTISNLIDNVNGSNQGPIEANTSQRG